jgi:formate hydrogenlyase subunit 3/multisubunit Na+/H+ antiporter MnhD subunit
MWWSRLMLCSAMADLSTLLLSFSLLATCGMPPLSYWLPGLARSQPHSPLVRPRFLHWLTDSYISNRFHVLGLLIALMMEAARTSETLVNFYQTTRRYNPEDSHLHTHRRENLKSYYATFLCFWL